MHLKSTCCCCLPDPLGEHPISWGPGLSWSLPTPCVVCFSVVASLGHHFVFFRVPTSLSPSPPYLWFSFLSWLVFLGSWPLWILPHPLCDLLFCPGFSGTMFYSVRVPASLGPPHTLFGLPFCRSFSRTSFCFFGGGSRPL